MLLDSLAEAGAGAMNGSNCSHKNEEANSKLTEELGELEKIISSLWVSSSLPIK